MSSSSSINSVFMKSLTAAATATALDYSMSRNQNMYTSLMIGVASGLGSAAGSYASSMIPSIFPTDTAANPLYKGQAVQERLFEFVGGYAGITLLQSYQTSLGRKDTVLEKTGVVLVSISVAEVLDDYLTSQPIGIFT